jgi:hypothetical protein
MSNTSKRIKIITYRVFQGGWAAKDVVLHALEEGDSILGPGLEISGGVELFDVFIKGLAENILTTWH